ncbi:MAG: HAD family phosphatase [Candidatus Bipolaricaulota bacterium]
MSRKLVLLDMDGTLLMGRSLRVLTVAFGLEGDLQAIQQEKAAQGLTEREVSERIAGLFTGQRLDEVSAVFDGVPLTPGAAAWVRALHEAGHTTYIVSDSWQPLVERLARRLAVNGVWANGLEVRGRRLTGKLQPPPCPAELPESCRRHSVCKAHALEVLAGQENVQAEETIAVGDGLIDVCMLQRAGIGVALNPKAEEVTQAADMVVYGDFYDLGDRLAPYLSEACRV